MGDRTRFARSALGAKIRSPLGHFIGFADSLLEIFTVPLFVVHGETFLITGKTFGASQGTGVVQIGDNPLFDDTTTIVNQTVNSWSDTSIEVEAIITSSVVDAGPIWIKVIADDGQYDSKISSLVAFQSVLQVYESLHDFRAGDEPCGVDADYYCAVTQENPSFDALNSWPADKGYGRGNYFASIGGISPGTDFFFSNSPGFYLIGGTSDKSVEFPQATSTYVSSGAPSIRYVTWCGVEGLTSYFGPSSLSTGGRRLRILYEQLEDAMAVCASSHGWTDTEDVYLVPSKPVTIQVTTPPSGALFAENSGAITFTAYSFDQGGDIGGDIVWHSSLDGVIGSGKTISPTLSVGNHGIEANIISPRGQNRYTRISVVVESLSITAVTPTNGDEAGGTSVTVIGTGFTESTTVEFDGTPATSVTLVDTQNITCETPSGTGVVDVVVIDGADSDTLTNGFEYGVEDIVITDISPSSGTSAGGTSVTITGTGFTADCVVLFLSDAPREATSVVFVNSTTITCDTPTGTGLASVGVADPVTGKSDAAINAYTYT